MSEVSDSCGKPLSQNYLGGGIEVKSVEKAEIIRRDEGRIRIRSSNGDLGVGDDIEGSAISANFPDREWQIRSVSSADIGDEGGEIVLVRCLLALKGITFALMPDHPDNLGGMSLRLDGGKTAGDRAAECRVVGASAWCPIIVESRAARRVFDESDVVVWHRIGDRPSKGDLRSELGKFSSCAGSESRKGRAVIE